MPGAGRPTRRFTVLRLRLYRHLYRVLSSRQQILLKRHKRTSHLKESVPKYHPFERKQDAITRDQSHDHAKEVKTAHRIPTMGINIEYHVPFSVLGCIRKSLLPLEGQRSVRTLSITLSPAYRILYNLEH